MIGLVLPNCLLGQVGFLRQHCLTPAALEALVLQVRSESRCISFMHQGTSHWRPPRLVHQRSILAAIASRSPSWRRLCKVFLPPEVTAGRIYHVNDHASSARPLAEERSPHAVYCAARGVAVAPRCGGRSRPELLRTCRWPPRSRDRRPVLHV